MRDEQFFQYMGTHQSHNKIVHGNSSTKERMILSASSKAIIGLTLLCHPFASSFLMTNEAGMRKNHLSKMKPSSSVHMTTTNRVDGLEDISSIMKRQSMSDMDFLISKLESEKLPFSLLSTADKVQEYITKDIDTILFDCDGVLYRGTDVIPNAANAIQYLMTKMNKQVLFVTNNAGSSRKQLRDKLSTLLDCPQLTEEQMISSSYSAATYLSQHLVPSSSNNNGKVHVIGSEGLCDEIANLGFDVVTIDKNESPSMSREELANYSFPDDERIDAVVVGLDTDFTYRKLCVANVLLQKNPKAILVATNRDAYDLVGANAWHLPGNGALVAALECASQRTAIHVGKPSSTLVQILMENYGIDPARTLMVGDRLDTDITFGSINNMKTALVLTGCTTTSDILDLLQNDDDSLKDEKLNIESSSIPSIIIPHMGLMGKAN